MRAHGSSAPRELADHMSADGARPRARDMTLANVLRTLRAEQRVSQLELAFAMGA